MTIERLLREGSIHPFTATPDEVNKAIEIARRDLSLAESIVKESQDWSFSIAYNAVLQACRAYMFHLGYRPASAVAHKATFEFMRLSVPARLKETISYFDRARRKRHRAMYDEAGLVTEKEAEELLKRARRFLSYIESEM